MHRHEPARRRLVRCERHESSISPERCLRCPRLVELALTPEREVCRVHCRSGGTERDASGTAPPLTLPRRTVAELMQRDVLCVRPELPVDAAMTLFLESGVAALPVVDDRGGLLGFLRESELSLTIQAGRLRRAGAGVRDVLFPYALALPESTPLTRASALMAQERQSEVAIVDPCGAIVGVASASDVLAWVGAADGYVTAESVRVAGFPRVAR